MTQYVMKIREKFIGHIKSGKKIREYRLNDETRKQIKQGDILILVSTINDNDYVRVRVKMRECFSSWHDALESYWEEDFKELYSSLDEAISECNHFYSRDEVKKYGIVVFGIEEDKRPLKNSCVLLDTNIIVQRESSNNVSAEVMKMYKWFEQLKCTKMIHPDTFEEINRYKNESVRNNMNLKLSSYEKVNPATRIPFSFKNVVEKYSSDPNSIIDNKRYFSTTSCRGVPERRFRSDIRHTHDKCR